ncbi:MAG: hypothetical protein ACLFVC_08170 [Opitutales bacterium]
METTCRLSETHERIAAAIDIDGNALGDSWEIARFGSLGQDADADPDDGNVVNGAEETAGTDPNDPHSDDDGVDDGTEIALGRDPLGADRIALDFLDNFERMNERKQITCRTLLAHPLHL